MRMRESESDTFIYLNLFVSIILIKYFYILDEKYFHVITIMMNYTWFEVKNFYGEHKRTRMVREKDENLKSCWSVCGMS